MNSKDFLIQSQLQILEIFKSQDPEFFDVVFEIEGKNIYANKIRLSAVSSTFKSMLSDRWISKNDVIKIETYKFDEFKKLLTFIYSGECKLTVENVMVMLDMAEFYQISYLKKLCKKYLTEMKCNFENVFQLIEIANKYDMIFNSARGFIVKNCSALAKCEKFLNASKFIVEEVFYILSYGYVTPEEIFLTIYKWAEHQSIKKEKETNEERFNKNDAIKAELFEFLPLIKFDKMKFSFLYKYVVKNEFLFSTNELRNVLDGVNFVAKVKITNLLGDSIFCTLPYDSDAVDIIKSLKNRLSDNSNCRQIFWNTACKIPSTPSSIKKKSNVRYYLILFYDGYIGVQHKDRIVESNYILAEMTQYGINFSMTPECEIEIE